MNGGLLKKAGGKKLLPPAFFLCLGRNSELNQGIKEGRR